MSIAACAFRFRGGRSTIPVNTHGVDCGWLVGLILVKNSRMEKRLIIMSRPTGLLLIIYRWFCRIPPTALEKCDIEKRGTRIGNSMKQHTAFMLHTARGAFQDLPAKASETSSSATQATVPRCGNTPPVRAALRFK